MIIQKDGEQYLFGNVYLSFPNKYTCVCGWDKWLDSSERLWGKSRKPDIDLSNLLNLRIIMVTFPPDLYPGTSIGFAGNVPCSFFPTTRNVSNGFRLCPFLALSVQPTQHWRFLNGMCVKTRLALWRQQQFQTYNALQVERFQKKEGWLKDSKVITRSLPWCGFSNLDVM